MVQQYRYSVNYELGFDQQDVLNVDIQQADPEIIKNEFEKLSFVPTVSMSSHALGAEAVAAIYVRQADNPDSIEASVIAVDENFISNMGLHLMQGRNFTSDAVQNSRWIIVNEVFAKKLSPTDPTEAIGRVMMLPDNREVSIAGIVKDFHYTTLTSPI